MRKSKYSSIQLKDMLTRLSIRFPDRVPKEDCDKILKNCFFYGIRSDIHNGICHLYDDDTVTFSQLLVKACRNEEEETASKLVNKSAVADSTLEERVDRLIAKSNQSNQPNPGLRRDNRDNSHNYGRLPFQSNQRSVGDYTNNPRWPPGDIRQNLRGPEPSAACPIGESDGSRLIQCFKCRGWGHPKCLCPYQLNYTRGEWYGNFSPRQWAYDLRVLLPTTCLLNNRYANISDGPKIS